MFLMVERDGLEVSFRWLFRVDDNDNKEDDDDDGGNDGRTRDGICVEEGRYGGENFLRQTQK